MVYFCRLGGVIFVVSATPTYVIAEDVKTRNSDAGATPTKEAVQPPHHCLPTINNPVPPLSAFYPHGYHTKVGRIYGNIAINTHTHAHV